MVHKFVLVEKMQSYMSISLQKEPYEKYDTLEVEG